MKSIWLQEYHLGLANAQVQKAWGWVKRFPNRRCVHEVGGDTGMRRGLYAAAPVVRQLLGKWFHDFGPL